MFWLVAPSVVAVSTTALLAGCAKGRDDVKRPKSSGSNRGSNKQKQSGKSTRKPGTSSKSSRRDPKAVGAAGVKKSSRSKREGASSKSGRSSKSAKPHGDKKKIGAAAPVAVAGSGAKVDKSSKSAGKSSSSKKRSEKDKLKKDKSVEDKSQRYGRREDTVQDWIRSSKRSSRSKRSSKSKKSNRSKKSESKKELQVDKTQELSTEDVAPKSKDVALKTAISPKAVSVTKLELAPVEGVAKHEVRIEPSELRWKSTGGIQNVAVYNHSNVRKALKIKCSDNLLYRVNPVHTFIPAGGSVRVDILRQNGTAKVDKIVIIAADAGKDDPNAREVLTRSTNTDMMVLPLIATAAN